MAQGLTDKQMNERGQLLAIVKEYCPDKLDEVKKSIY